MHMWFAWLARQEGPIPALLCLDGGAGAGHGPRGRSQDGLLPLAQVRRMHVWIDPTHTHAHHTSLQSSLFIYMHRPVAELVRSGVELGEADDRVFRRVNSKQVRGWEGEWGVAVPVCMYVLQACLVAWRSN
jgi:hypothetical protein